MKFYLPLLAVLLTLGSCKKSTHPKDVEVTLLTECESEYAKYVITYNENGKPIRVEKQTAPIEPDFSGELIYRELEYPDNGTIRSVGYNIVRGQKYKNDSSIFIFNSRGRIGKIDRMILNEGRIYLRDTFDFSLSEEGTIKSVESPLFSPNAPKWILKDENLHYQNSNYNGVDAIKLTREYEDHYTSIRNPFCFEDLEKILYHSFGYRNFSVERFSLSGFSLQQLCSRNCPSSTRFREEYESRWVLWRDVITENKMTYEMDPAGKFIKMIDRAVTTTRTKSNMEGVVSGSQVEWKFKYITKIVKR